MRDEARDTDGARFWWTSHPMLGKHDFSLGILKHFKLGINKNTRHQVKDNSIF